MTEPVTAFARRAVVADAESIARIYNQGIADRSASFETQPRTASDVSKWFEGKHPIVVVEQAGEIVAFAATFQWRAQPHFAGIAEPAVYVAREHRGAGLGRIALDALVDAVRLAGGWKLLGALFADNEGSRSLMRAAGFREVGVYQKQAQLEGRWKDVLLVEKLLPENLRAENKVVFACVHNAGRSQMAAAFFNALADPARARAISAGTQPGERVHPEVTAVMAEAGIDLTHAVPARLTAELAVGARLLVTMGCGDACPFIPGAERDDWPLRDPKGLPMVEVRQIRDDIEGRVRRLLIARGWQRQEGLPRAQSFGG